MNRKNKNFNVFACAAFLLGTVCFAGAQDQSAPKPDNTKTNQRDRNSAEPTADQQKENGSDRDLAKQIRASVVKDGSLSTYAHNVKIIVQDATVTLRGPVRSDDEKQAIEKKAAAISGVKNVVNELQVAPESK